ncbi:potassium/sodium hyperpolarization-activated cyclic nucleotide-gated channel 1-like [Vespula squamosa]|uniref:Potassium/sodium hyperpolarization-activated cyclic nucleotide-gated channel 1-like n=1 Tax=Vespula squamosa TaxID=30214 RepID=A0ABD1ZSU8_VESSQ
MSKSSDVHEGQVHVCKLLRTLENWKNITCCWEWKKLWSQWFNINKRTPRCMQYIDNMSIVNIEKRRYARLNKLPRLPRETNLPGVDSHPRMCFVLDFYGKL